MSTGTTAAMVPAVMPNFVQAPDNYQQFLEWQAVAAKTEQYSYDGLDPRYVAPETRRLHEALEDAAAVLAERYAVTGPADTISAWVVYFLDQFERKLGDPAKAAAMLADLERNLQARIDQGGW